MTETVRHSWIALFALCLGVSVNNWSDAVLVGTATLLVFSQYIKIFNQLADVRESLRISADSSVEAYAKSRKKYQDLLNELIAEREHSLQLTALNITLSAQIRDLLTPMESQ